MKLKKPIMSAAILAALFSFSIVYAESITVYSDGSSIILKAIQLQQVSGIEVDLTYDPDSFKVTGVDLGGFVHGGLVSSNFGQKGRARVGIIHPEGVNGSGTLLTLRGTKLNPLGAFIRSGTVRMADIDGKTRMIALRFVNPDVSNQVQNGGNKEKEVIDSQEPLVVQIGTGITSREEEGSIQKESESANSDSASKEVEGEYPFEAEKEGQRDSRYVEDQEPKVDKKFKKKFVDEGNGNSERELVQLGSTDKPLDGYVFKDESFLKLLNAICDKKKQYWYQNPFLLTSGKSSVVEIMLPAGEYNLDNFVVEGGRVLGCRVDKSKTIVKIYPLENVKEVNLFVFSGNELKLIPIFIRKYKNLPWSIHAPDRNGINSYIKDWVKKNVVDGMAVSGIEDLLDVLVNYAVQAGYSCD